ncbi:CobD/CbiB family protein [Denitratisoma sp. agr-D3]
MTLFSALIALFIEQFLPLPADRWVDQPLGRCARWLEDKLDDGQYRHGIVAWCLGVAVPSLLVQGLYLFLLWAHPLLAALLGLCVLYVTMGFRQFSHFFTDLQASLRAGELEQARSLLAQWTGRNCDRLNASEMARVAIEQALVASHRHVFAPLYCFALLGPAGAMVYRLSAFYAGHWRETIPVPGQERSRFGEFSRRAFFLIDWLPIRLTATGFAVVGDFEDAVYCWRGQASHWPDITSGVLLSSGAGAMGISLGLPLHDDLDVEDRPELGLGDPADVDHMQSTIGLVWRTLVLGLLVLALFWVASWVG